MARIARVVTTDLAHHVSCGGGRCKAKAGLMMHQPRSENPVNVVTVPRVLPGNGVGYTFWNHEFPELMTNLEEAAIGVLEILF